MKNYLIRGIGLIIFFALASGSIFPQDEKDDQDSGFPLSGGVEGAIYSQYVWRGMELNDECVFQPEVCFSLLGLELSVWGNLELTDSLDHKGEFTEVDYGISYAREFGSFSASLSYVYYDYPNTGAEKSQEAGLELEWGDPLALRCQVNYDFDQARGVYLRPSVSYSLDLFPLTLTSSAGLGWASQNYNEYNFGVRRDSLVDLEVFLGAEADLGSGFCLSLLGSYYSLVGNDLRAEIEEGKEGFWGGGSLGFSF